MAKRKVTQLFGNLQVKQEEEYPRTIFFFLLIVFITLGD